MTTITTAGLLDELKRADETRESHTKTRNRTIEQLEILRGEMAQLQGTIDKMQCGIDLSTRDIQALQERIAIRLKRGERA